MPDNTVTEQTEDDRLWMKRALELAAQAASHDEVPVGAVVVLDGREVGTGYNAPISSCDPTGHAEIRALRDAAARVGNYRLSGATLYVTLEPCTMCVGALVHSRISRLVYGATEPKGGAVESIRATLEEPHFNWTVATTSGILSAECGQTLTDFFAARREQIRRARNKPQA
ncbi:tRNA-specific adenosine deaminase [Marinobacter zhanjiangensis]|uniref:tRNA-specific adenosine deaminase n=2 Tax=Marinobacter zhanjiangensis TaxID=578215 RepID=A0ABQ3B8R9_9GAMM|nr:tRNA-specific adenosine deaminase [Marinobacter zhanjiangensis]